MRTVPYLRNVLPSLTLKDDCVRCPNSPIATRNHESLLLLVDNKPNHFDNELIKKLTFIFNQAANSIDVFDEGGEVFYKILNIVD